MYLAIQLGSLIHVAAAAECYGLARAEKVSPQLVYNLIAGAAGSSAQFNVYFPDMFRQDFKSKAAGFDTLDKALRNLVS